MRMAGAVTLGVLILEVLLAGAFLLGYFWLDGWRWGLLFSAVLLLLIVLPWLGDLKMVFDSAGPRGAVRVGWWARASFMVREDATHLIVRVLGIPIRRRFPSKAEKKTREQAEVSETSAPEPTAAEAETPECAAEVTEEPRKVEKTEKARKAVSVWKRLDSETIEGGCRALGSALGATCELVWGADEIRVAVQDPVGKPLPDSALEQIIGCREVGPVDLTVSSGPGERRVRAIYRIGLLRAVLAGVQMVIDGKLPEFAKKMKRKREQPAPEVVDDDQRIIDRIVEQQEALCEEVEE